MLKNSDSKTGHGIRTRGIMEIKEIYNISIIGNIITGFNYGMRCEDSYNILILDNIIGDNKYGGISVEDSHNFDIKFNNITYSYCDENNGYGMGTSVEGLHHYYYEKYETADEESLKNKHILNHRFLKETGLSFSQYYWEHPHTPIDQEKLAKNDPKPSRYNL